LKISRAAPAAVALSIGFVVVYSLLFGVRFEDIVSIGFGTLFASSLLILLRLIVQGIRFHLLTSGLDIRRSVASSVFVRVSSEFVSLATPTFIGGEAVRIAWLKVHGAELGKAAWLIFLEIYLDVVSTALVVYASVLYLLVHQEYLIAALGAAVSTATTAFFTFIFLFSRKSILHIPSWLQRVIKVLLGESRGGRIIDSVEQTLLGYHNSASNTHSIFASKRTLGILLCTIAMIFLSGAVTQIILASTPTLGGLLLSTSGFYISLVIGALPITIGGSGISELVLSHFAANILGSSSWARVIAWRILTYHIPLTISGLSLTLLSYRELTPKKIKSVSCTSS
jgi:hypothetical protein